LIRQALLSEKPPRLMELRQDRFSRLLPKLNCSHKGNFADTMAKERTIEGIRIIMLICSIRMTYSKLPRPPPTLLIS